jgi:KDO2-lipid IV(A) lauroyltransferase
VLIFLIQALSSVFCLLPRRWCLGLMASAAGVVFCLYSLSPYRRFIQGNLRAAFPDWSQARIQQVAWQHVKHLFQAVADLLRFPRWQTHPPGPDTLQVVGLEHVQAAWQEGRGVILASAHMGCWEMITATVAMAGLPTHVLVQPPTVDAFARLFAQFRASVGVVTHNNTSLSSLRPVLRQLARGAVVGMLVDQHGESRRLTGSFFGHEVSLPEGPAFFARHCGSLIVPVFAWREGDCHHICFEPPLVPEDSPQVLMQALYQRIEAAIQAHPDDWLWTYNRWDKYP